MVAEYALNEVLPDPEQLTNPQRMALLFVLPVLDSGRKKAKFSLESAGKNAEAAAALRKFDLLWGRDSAKNHHEGEKEIETETEKETKKEAEIDIEGESLEGNDSFESFWNCFPKKVCKEKARSAFEKVTVPTSVLLEAVRRQKQSMQWQQGEGQFVPNPATWLLEKRWEDELPTPKEVKASGILGETEREAIRKMMEG